MFQTIAFLAIVILSRLCLLELYESFYHIAPCCRRFAMSTQSVSLLRGDPVPLPHEYERVVEERVTRNRTEYRSARKGENSHTVVAGDLAAECDAVEEFISQHAGASSCNRNPHAHVLRQAAFGICRIRNW